MSQCTVFPPILVKGTKPIDRAENTQRTGFQATDIHNTSVAVGMDAQSRPKNHSGEL